MQIEFKAERREVIPIGKNKVKMPQVEFNLKAIKEIKKRKKISTRKEAKSSTSKPSKKGR